MIFRTPTPPIAGCSVCGAEGPNWYGQDGWLCDTHWDDLQQRHQTVYGSFKGHTLLMLDSVAQSYALTDSGRAQWLWTAIGWLEANVPGDDVRFVILGHEKVFQEPSEALIDCVARVLAESNTTTPFPTLLDRLADEVRRAIGPSGTGS